MAVIWKPKGELTCNVGTAAELRVLCSVLKAVLYPFLTINEGRPRPCLCLCLSDDPTVSQAFPSDACSPSALLLP